MSKDAKRILAFAERTYSLRTSSCDFLGINSSIYGASNGYVSTILVLIARWTEDLTFDFAPAEMLLGI